MLFGKHTFERQLEMDFTMGKGPSYSISGVIGLPGRE